MTHSIEFDVMRAEQAWTHAIEQFNRERLEEKKDFFLPLNRLNLKSMDNLGKKVKVKLKPNKVIQNKQQANIAFISMVHSQDQADLHTIIVYALTPVHHYNGTTDSFLAKTNKVKGYRVD